MVDIDAMTLGLVGGDMMEVAVVGVIVMLVECVACDRSVVSTVI